MLKSALLVLSVSVCACGSLPPFPEVTQYSVHADVPRPGFYGINNRTNARVYRRFDDPKMKGAQVLDANDYRKSESWIDEIERIAQERCQ